MDDPRFLRQVLLAEVGPEGQARIAAATARVSGDAEASLAHDVAERYARGAGFGAVAEGAIDVAALAPESIVEAPAAREVLAGARAALAAMRAALAPESIVEARAQGEEARAQDERAVAREEPPS